MHLCTWVVLLMATILASKCRAVLGRISQEHKTYGGGQRFIEPKDRQNNDYKGGNTTITGDGGLFYKPIKTAEDSSKRYRQSGTSEPTSYIAYMRPDEDVYKIYIDLNIRLRNPKKGKCIDKFEIIGAPRSRVPVLCGEIQQKLFIDHWSPSGDPVMINVTVSDVPPPFDDNAWFFRISYIRYTDNFTVPWKCLQYHFDDYGHLISFNGEDYIKKKPRVLKNQKYSICFKIKSSTCHVRFEIYFLDLGTGNRDKECKDRKNYVLIGNKKYCGEGTNYNIVQNITVNAYLTPVVVKVRVGNDKTVSKGFHIDYFMIPCGEDKNTYYPWPVDDDLVDYDYNYDYSNARNSPKKTSRPASMQHVGRP